MNNLAYSYPLPQRAAQGLLTENIHAIRLTDPRLDALLQENRSPCHRLSIEWLADGDLFVHTQDSDYRISDPSPPLIRSDPEIPVLMMGVGSGKTVGRLLSDLRNPLLIIEPELGLIREILNHQNWKQPILDRRLRILVPDIHDPILSQISLQECVADIQHRVLESGGNSCWVASGSFELNRAFFNQVEQSLSFLTEWTGFMAHAKRIRRPEEDPDDITVVSPQCRIFDDLARCFRHLGLKTRLWRVPDASGVWTPAQWREAYLQSGQKPAHVFLFRNRTLLETEKATERYHWEHFIPGKIVSWWWDVPNVASRIDFEHQTRGHINFAFARDIASGLPGQAQWLPPGALTPFSALPVSLGTPPKPDLPVTFVGQSRMQQIITNLKILHQTLQNLCGQEGAFLSSDIERKHNILELYDYLQKKKDDISRLIGKIAPGRPWHAYYLDYIFQMVLTGLFRLAAVLVVRRAAIPLLIFGDEGWVDSGVVDRSAFKGLIAPDRLPALYQRSAVNLNLNFMQVSSTVNPKVLDACAACGTVLTDYRPELEELFPDPGTRPFHFTTLEELPETLTSLLHTDLTEHRIRLMVHTRRVHSLRERARMIWSVVGGDR
jgi:hypothetical protein